MLAARSPIRLKTALTVTGFLTLSLMLAGVSLGQIKSGVLVGTVLDSGGAAVPGSTVTVINPETNITLTAVTDENGSFTVPYLPAGTYVVEVEKTGSGFAKYRRPDITVSTAQTVKVEIKLQTGVISETVVVTGEAAQLQASNATVQISNNFTAEYGRAQGVVVFTTKSGTNDYHGTAFYRIRNEALNANGFANNANRIAKGPFKSNTFGGTVGGRIIRDKAFFFVSYEGLRFHRSYPFLMTVPTEAERRGDFSNTYVRVGTQNIPIRIYDPFSATRVGTTSNYQRAQFPTFVDAQGVERTLPLPAGRINQFGLAVLNAYPKPNRTADDIFNTNNFFSQGRQEFTKNNLNSRVDYNRGRHSFYATYGFQKSLILTPRSWGEDNQYSGRNKAGEFVGNNP